MNNHEQKENKSWEDYLPLMVVVALSALAALALQVQPAAEWNLHGFMLNFMGVFLLLFSLFKLINVQGFADGFSMYDLLATRWRPYGLIYPFLELGLSLAYLSRIELTVTYIATIALMGFGSLGVFHALKKGLKINCACMGTVLNVPLSTVAVVEDLGMAIMALVMLLMGS